MVDSTGSTSGWWERLRRRKLRNYLFLDLRLQLNFAAALAGVGMITGIFFIAAFYLYFQGSFLRVSDVDPDYMPMYHVLRVNSGVFVQALTVVSIAYITLLFLLGLLFSHRIAGPLVNITGALTSIARGRVPSPVALRRSDMLQPFAASINDLIKSIVEQRRRMRCDIEEAVVALRDGKTEDAEAARQKLQRLLDDSLEGPKEGQPE